VINMTKTPRKQTVEIEIDLLRRIAEYYEFPLAVFFSDKSIFKHKTRSETLRKKAEAFDKIAEIVEDYKHEIHTEN